MFVVSGSYLRANMYILAFGVHRGRSKKNSPASRTMFSNSFVDSCTFSSCLLQHALAIIILFDCHHHSSESPRLEMKQELAGSHHFR